MERSPESSQQYFGREKHGINQHDINRYGTLTTRPNTTALASHCQYVGGRTSLPPPPPPSRRRRVTGRVVNIERAWRLDRWRSIFLEDFRRSEMKINARRRSACRRRRRTVESRETDRSGLSAFWRLTRFRFLRRSRIEKQSVFIGSHARQTPNVCRSYFIPYEFCGDVIRRNDESAIKTSIATKCRLINLPTPWR